METYNGKFLINNIKYPVQQKLNTDDTIDPKSSGSFGNVLQSLQNEVKFSKHAMERLNDRNISLTKNQVNRLEDGVSKAKEKGLKESLVLLDNVALVVSIKNNTVITATTSNKDNESKVFTNIDGAIIV
ncbi:MAG: TIGR02530 family flagellar biosynthesis protein [Lachnospirales bacterium]